MTGLIHVNYALCGPCEDGWEVDRPPNTPHNGHDEVTGEPFPCQCACGGGPARKRMPIVQPLPEQHYYAEMDIDWGEDDPSDYDDEGSTR